MTMTMHSMNAVIEAFEDYDLDVGEVGKEINVSPMLLSKYIGGDPRAIGPRASQRLYEYIDAFAERVAEIRSAEHDVSVDEPTIKLVLDRAPTFEKPERKKGPRAFNQRLVETLHELVEHPDVWSEIMRLPKLGAIKTGHRAGQLIDNAKRAGNRCSDIRTGRLQGIEKGEFEAAWELQGDEYVVFAVYVGEER